MVCMAGKKKKIRPTFAIGKFVEEVKQQTRIAKEGVLEFFTELAFIHWLGKPKNGAIEAAVVVLRPAAR